MGLFKNEVGRPSNETVKKRKIFYSITIVLSLGIILGGGYFVKNYFSSGKISGIYQNASVTSKKFSLTATSDGSIYKSNTWTANKVTLKVVQNSSLKAKSYTWYKNGKKYSSCKSSSCVIKKEQESTYYVVVKATNGQSYTTSSIIVKIDNDVLKKVWIMCSNGCAVGTSLSAESGSTINDSLDKMRSYKCQWYRNGKAISGETDCSIIPKTTGSYKAKITTPSGSSSKITAPVEVNYSVSFDAYCGSKKCNNRAYEYPNFGAITYYNDSVVLKTSVTGTAVKSYTWYKDNKKYSACKNKSTCTVTSGSGLFHVEIKTSDGRKYETDSEGVGVDKTKWTIKSINNATKSGNKYTSKINKTLGVIVSNADMCGGASFTHNVYWYKKSGNTYTKIEDASLYARYTPTRAGTYKVVVYACNGTKTESIIKVTK